MIARPFSELSERSENKEGLTMRSEPDMDPTGMFIQAADSYVEKRRSKQSYSWKELQDIENRRRAILNRVELPFWRILCFWDGTCLGVLSRDFLFWASIAIYVSIRVKVWYGGLPPFVANVGETSNIDIIGGFLSFFLVLFVNQSNVRFTEMWKHSMACAGRIFDVSQLAATSLPKPNALRLVRYLNGAHSAGYVGLSKTYTKRSCFDELNRSLKFLTDEELSRIEECDMDHCDDCFRELLTWAMMEVQVAQMQELIDGRLGGMMREKIAGLRNAMDGLYDYNSQPIHFFYIHFLSLLTAIYLPIFAVANAYSAGTGDDLHWASDVLSGLIVMLQAIFVIGLRLLGQKMVDAYGDDLEDLSVLHYVRDTWKTSNRILATQFPSPVDPQMEENIQYSAASLGSPWDVRQRRQPSQSSVMSGISTGVSA